MYNPIYNQLKLINGHNCRVMGMAISELTGYFFGIIYTFYNG